MTSKHLWDSSTRLDSFSIINIWVSYISASLLLENLQPAICNTPNIHIHIINLQDPASSTLSRIDIKLRYHKTFQVDIKDTNFHPYTHTHTPHIRLVRQQVQEIINCQLTLQFWGWRSSLLIHTLKSSTNRQFTLPVSTGIFPRYFCHWFILFFHNHPPRPLTGALDQPCI